MKLLSPPVSFLPARTPLSRKGILSFPLPEDSHPERIGVYRLSPGGDSWRPERGESGKEKIDVPLGRLGTFALLRDDSPPRILGVDPSGARVASSAHLLFKVRVEDRGSGLNYDGVRLLLDGAELETEYDPDRGWATASPPERLAPGIHRGKAWAVDRAGNRSATLPFEVRLR